MASILDRLQHAWNAFNDYNTHRLDNRYFSQISSYARPDRVRLTMGNESTITSSVYNRIALDVAAITLEHVKIDENKRYIETVDSYLNQCLTTEANIDQTSRAFIQDVVLTMFDEGAVAIVPVETTINPNISGSYDIKSMRVGKIVEWMPKHVKVEVYNDLIGQKQQIVLSKSVVAIIQNPLYTVINEPNSTMKRLIRKLALLDVVDEQSGSGKLDLIVTLPYAVNNPLKREQAETRRKDIETQLATSKYGIAYMDGTEHVTQLNRSVENKLMDQVEYLTSMLYSQLGITDTIMNGTADADAMTNYNSRTIEPIVSAIVDEMKRKFITKTARSQGQSITFFRDPFRLVPVNDLADIADKFTRNEILSSNEVRQIIGMKPVNDPKADELRNKNINPGDEQTFATTNGEEVVEGGEENKGEIQNGE